MRDEIDRERSEPVAAFVVLPGDGGKCGGAVRSIEDMRPDHPGPLAGIEALLGACNAPWLLTVPVDLAQVPEDLFDLVEDVLLHRMRPTYAALAEGWTSERVLRSILDEIS